MKQKNKLILLMMSLSTSIIISNWSAGATAHTTNNDSKKFLEEMNIKIDNEAYPKVPKIEIKDTSKKKKEFVHTFVDWGVCSSGYTKSNMDLSSITNINSKQYSMKSSYWLDDYGHYRYSENGIDYYVVALGSYYGNIGDKFKITLSNGTVFYVIKGDEKSDTQTVNGCYHPDGSVIEFIIDTNAVYNSYFNFHGGFQVYDKWNGTITKVEKEV